MEEIPGPARPQAPGVHRRNLGQDQYDPPPRALATWHPPDRQAAARPLADIDLSGGLALRPDRRALPSTGRSTAPASALTSNSSWSPPSTPATLSSWTTSAVIRAKRFA